MQQPGGHVQHSAKSDERRLLTNSTGFRNLYRQ
jgi:hypothetical protein